VERDGFPARYIASDNGSSRPVPGGAPAVTTSRHRGHGLGCSGRWPRARARTRRP